MRPLVPTWCTRSSTGTRGPSATKEPKARGGSMRKPGAYCGHCKRRDSHTEDECWEKHLDKRPEKWKQPRAEEPARPAYAAAEVGGEDDPMSPDFDPFTTWGAHLLPVQAPGVDVMAVGTPEDYPEVRPGSTMAQLDTEPAARARGSEAERMRAKAKEDRVRRGGPPPAFGQRGSGPHRTREQERQRRQQRQRRLRDRGLHRQARGGGGSRFGDEAEEEGSEEEGEDAEGAAEQAAEEDYGVEDKGDAADLTPADRAMQTIPARYRYFPPVKRR
ncbi:hypothetical protein KFL_003160010 [Klebsormidium nitens]|uniref:Uncharacterized protein n=1 Tax=Klebsormidium nitens TaxID=105231 RepID=A0A1Y1IFG5_KLENI|nr:hypothetical protein KFL_003160010 [Klebsormidium nitens]|eukprot:GAQ86848.1 hypothetical protein KFL_003160010 [Klebsormidium nitens]